MSKSIRVVLLNQSDNLLIDSSRGSTHQYYRYVLRTRTHQAINQLLDNKRSCIDTLRMILFY